MTTRPSVWQPGVAVTASRPVSPRQLAWRRFRRHRLGMVGLVILLIIVFAAIFAPIVAPYDPLKIDPKAFAKPPSAAHLMGTDGSGRDIFSRVIWGARVSLLVGLGAVTIFLIIGTVLGAIAGFFRGPVDGLIMRLTDMFLAFPVLIILIALVPVLGRSLVSIVLVLGLFGWPATARLVRGEFLSLREREFTMAARGIGAKNSRIIGRHMMPNVASALVVLASFGVAEAIIAEAGLSLLGLGIPAPEPSWGQMLTISLEFATLVAKPWMWIPPAVALAVTVLSINFIGDGLRDALDPRANVVKR